MRRRRWVSVQYLGYCFSMLAPFPPEQLPKAHPPIKPNRARTHRRRS